MYYASDDRSCWFISLPLQSKDEQGRGGVSWCQNLTYNGGAKERNTTYPIDVVPDPTDEYYATHNRPGVVHRIGIDRMELWHDENAADYVCHHVARREIRFRFAPWTVDCDTTLTQSRASSTR